MVLVISRVLVDNRSIGGFNIWGTNKVNSCSTSENVSVEITMIVSELHTIQIGSGVPCISVDIAQISAIKGRGDVNLLRWRGCWARAICNISTNLNVVCGRGFASIPCCVYIRIKSTVVKKRAEINLSSV